MGVYFSRLWSNLFTSGPMSIVMLGLDAAGKTTILFKLKLVEVVPTLPTIGFNAETVQYRNLTFTVWDVGGQTAIRRLWPHYYNNAKALIFVVDSNDPSRFPLASEEFHGVLSADELRDVPVLIFANKQDLPQAWPTSAVAKGLELDKLRDRKWYIQGCTATSGDGLFDGLDWLAKELNY